jgi:hypothetical protein
VTAITGLPAASKSYIRPGTEIPAIPGNIEITPISQAFSESSISARGLKGVIVTLFNFLQLIVDSSHAFLGPLPEKTR